MLSVEIMDYKAAGSGQTAKLPLVRVLAELAKCFDRAACPPRATIGMLAARLIENG
jgi:hypothetical protein